MINSSLPVSEEEVAPIVLAYYGRTQLRRAIDESESAFEDLVSLALMVEPDLDALSLFSLRGDSHRPGIRGLVIDRANLSRKAGLTPGLDQEMYASILVNGVLGAKISLHAYGEDPFPLGHLLSLAAKRSTTEKILTSSSAIFSRLKVAARWHAKAHWALDIADAVLALGISFDSMLSETGPSPGRVISERFALLDPNPSIRRERYRDFQNEFYPARSAVAHGAKKTSIDTKFVRHMAKESRWVFARIFQLAEKLQIRTEDEYSQMFENFKWNGASAEQL